tara:strand:+ start:409 stop:600 length:192 start_codon:yes stop_codon:yes gene_type:complete
MTKLDKESVVAALDGERVIECLDLRDGEGNPVNDDDVVAALQQIYNQAIDNCVNAVKDMEGDE